MARAPLYRSDLLLTLAAGGRAIPRAFAGHLCGFDYDEPVPPQPEPGEGGAVEPVSHAIAGEEPKAASAPKQQLAFWHAASIEVKSRADLDRIRRPPSEIENAASLTNDDIRYEDRPLPGSPLVHWSRLWPFLREALGRRKPGRRPDLPRVVRLLAEGRALVRLPRQHRRSWHPEVHLLEDRREALSPFWNDYDDLKRRLKGVRGKGGLRVTKVQRDGDALIDVTGPAIRSLALPPGHAVVVALGDLGQYEGGFALDPWFALGRQLRQRGIVPQALCPCPRDRWSSRMSRLWQIAAWDRGLRLPLRGAGQRAEPVPPEDRAAVELGRSRKLDELFLLISPAIRVERGLLRDARLLLPHGKADAGTEYDAFQSRDARGTGAGLDLSPEKLRELRAQLNTLDPALLAQAVGLLLRHHGYCRQVFGLTELLGLREILAPDRWQALIASGVLGESEHEEARAYWRRLAASLWRDSFGMYAAGMKSFAMRDLGRLQGDALRPVEMQAIWAMANPGPHRDLPPWIDPEAIAWLDPQQGPETTRTVLLAEGIVAGSADENGIPLGSLESHGPSCVITLHHRLEGRFPIDKPERPWGEATRLSPARLEDITAITLSSGQETLHLEKMPRPRWAARMFYDRQGLAAEVDMGGKRHRLRWKLPAGSSRLDSGAWPILSGKPLGTTFGHWVAESHPAWATRLWADDCGVAAEFRVGTVPFVLRWIPPGRFLMGSPEDEPGRYGDEGPQHEVTISRGFWMGETPVTQAQWRAVVEAARANAPLWKKLFKKDPLKPEPSHFKGPGELPVEQVSWEDSTAFCRLLDAVLPDGPGFRLPTEAQWEYACRAGTGSAFNDGSDCTEPMGKDPALDRLGSFLANSDGKTHAVKSKPESVNAWGIFDMHGNVWEWCMDGMRAYTAEDQRDPEGTTEKSAGRVVRGGSWDSRAGNCRAACRGRRDPGGRWDYQGLRLAAGQELGAAEPLGAERPPGAEGRSRGGKPSA